MNGGAVRSQGSRRHTRDNNASPYSRPGSVATKKSSGWSLTGLLSYLNPLRPFTSSSNEANLAESDAAQRLKQRGEEIAQLTQQQPPNPSSNHDRRPSQAANDSDQQQHIATSQSHSPPQTVTSEQRTSPRSDDSAVTSSANLQKVQEFLDQKRGRPLNQVEFAGLVSLLQNSVEDDDDHPEPFRFSKSPSTPARGATPTINFLSPSTSEQMVAAAGAAAQNGRKTLSKNPMGVYRWQGGGSARPRNRYQSPAFGSKVAWPTIKLTPEKPKTDSKRRRVGEDATTSSPQPVPKPTFNTSTSSGSTSSSVSMANGTQSGAKSNGAVPSTPRIRTSGTGVAKPTAPAVPSPLRQTWSQSDSPPQTSPSQPVSKPTRAATFMTELIKEVTPPKKPDFANPYEAVSPLPRPAQKKQPVRKTRSAARANAEKVKEQAKEQAKEKEKEPELTPQAIIEATVPKGSKRARPPPELIGQKSLEKRVKSPPEVSSARRSTRLNGTDAAHNGTSQASTVTVSEVTDEEQPSPKKQRTASSKPNRAGSFNVEEIDDVEMSSSTGNTAALGGTYTLPSEVVEPGEEKAEKKRATSPSSTPAFPGFPRATFPPAKSSAPKAPSKLRFSIQVEKDEKMDVASEPVAVSSQNSEPVAASAPSPSGPPDKPKDARALVAAMREEDLPKYTFDIPPSSLGAGPSTLRAKETAKAAPVSTLPTFDFSNAQVAAAAPTPAPASVSGGFNWQAAGIKPPPKPSGDTWSCSVCMLSNPGSADKCTVCEAPREDKPKAAVTQGFDWSKAGLKPPPKPSGDTWTCSVCMLSNPGGAVKCTVCDSPR